MISAKTIKSIEYDKILSSVSDCAVLYDTKELIKDFNPVSDFSEAEFLLKKTKEAYEYLYTYSVGGIYFCKNIYDELKRVDMGGTLNNAELLNVASNLKSARTAKHSIESVNDEKLTLIKNISSLLYTNQDFEKEIASKIISEDEISDTASPRLFSIRKSIHSLNAKIRDQLNSYMRGGFSKYLQESVVTMRQDRYVIPVKSEYRSFVKGFIHDQSSSGATVFVEPEMVMELNNDLKRAMIDEANEIHRILVDLTAKVSVMTEALRYNYQNLIELDFCFARAEYSFSNKCTYPNLNDKGIIDIKRGRHPLIAKDKVIPVNVSLGEKYNFLLISGPNTGGKTVTLKLVGLITVMAMSGLFIPADDDSKVSFFSGVYSDVGDEQSIEQSLSTFSSHIINIKNILNVADKNSLVLLDEIGAGTDPEEGSALALALIKKLIEINAFGIITTHYSKLKEYAVNSDKIENASMEFDSKTLRPMYKINIGIPGSSNAIHIAKVLGIEDSIIKEAENNLSDDKVSFENILKKAEESKRQSDELNKELEKIKAEKNLELNKIKEEKERIIKEREKIYATSKAETKRIVADKLEEAEEIIDELKAILKKAGLESKEIFRASELKNRLKNSKYLSAENDDTPIEMIKSNVLDVKIGDKCYIKSLNSYAIITFIKPNKKEIEVSIGNVRTLVKPNDIFNVEKPKKAKEQVSVSRKAISGLPIAEINVIGKTSLEAIGELEDFIAQAVMHGLEEIKVIHGVGEGILLKTIREFLKKDKRIKEFRRGKYGEGENGVTIITLK